MDAEPGHDKSRDSCLLSRTKQNHRISTNGPTLGIESANCVWLWTPGMPSFSVFRMTGLKKNIPKLSNNLRKRCQQHGKGADSPTRLWDSASPSRCEIKSAVQARAGVGGFTVTHTQTQTQTEPQTHIFLHIDTHMHAHRHTHTRTHTYKPAHKCTWHTVYRQKNAKAHRHKIHSADTDTWTRPTKTPAHAHTHTHTHTNKSTHKHTNKQNKCTNQMPRSTNAQLHRSRHTTAQTHKRTMYVYAETAAQQTPRCKYFTEFTSRMPELGLRSF